MYWIEENNSDNNNSDTIDYTFNINCKEIPIDHIYQLSKSIEKILPWITSNTGLHHIHCPAEGNGWERPSSTHNTNTIQLSKRTKLKLRIPSSRLNDIKKLSSQTIFIDGYPIIINNGNYKPVTPHETLFSRFIPYNPEASEEEFIQLFAQKLQEHDIIPKKILCGKTNSFQFPDKTISTRSIMIANLNNENSLRLQQIGYGTMQHFGFGIFIPHKDINALS
ncbi:MAG: type I-MYXAN CRISPR-associated protein Cas6/Cmx6 [Methylococcales bacterium]|mgnify:FL=1|jgi:CRISPR-associated protein Cas6|nr:type I-MYXAN CRISPR-associated protein Cas6/Cmx6 [Methylococcales bacterium]MBT7411383.1 type I-MYXAN CRISPR-associated protein Cas6/Cmx6 [Methylococcales bacterium]